MAIFCTKCGTSNEDGAGFCDNCGAPLRAALAKAPDIGLTSQQPTAAGHTTPTGSVTNINPKKIIFAAAGLAVVLILGGGAMYFILQPPAATPSTLLAAAKAGYGKETIDRFKRELCISNIDYSRSTFNAGENDRRTQDWLNALVTAGLYSPPVAINSGGFFAQTLLEYAATPELEKYRQGSKLCVAKDVEFAGVTDIGKPVQESLAQNGKPPTVLRVKTKLLLQSVNAAPWMEMPQVRDAVMPAIDGWEYKDKVLQKQVDEVFGLKDNKWTTGIAYKASVEKQIKNAWRFTDEKESNVEAKSNAGSFGSRLSNLFTFGNPLKGTWRGVAIFGIPIELTFTADAMQTNGQSISVDFVVDGKRVKVTPKGANTSTVFVLEDPDTVFMGEGEYRVLLNRVK